MNTKQLRQKILDLAIRGKLVPQDPDDEPASVLLDRVCAEKERLIKEGKIKRSKGDSKIYRGDDKSQYGQLPQEWVLCRFTDIASQIGDGLHGTPMYDSNGEYYFINGNNLDIVNPI